MWHDKNIMRREFAQVLLFNSRLQLFPGKLKSKWSGPFTVVQGFPYGGVEILYLEKEQFKVNAQRLKPYFRGAFPIGKQDTTLGTTERR